MKVLFGWLRKRSAKPNTSAQRLEEELRLNEEIDRFRNQIGNKTTSQWTPAEHAGFASIRRREDEL